MIELHSNRKGATTSTVIILDRSQETASIPNSPTQIVRQNKPTSQARGMIIIEIKASENRIKRIDVILLMNLANKPAIATHNKIPKM